MRYYFIACILVFIYTVAILIINMTFVSTKHVVSTKINVSDTVSRPYLSNRSFVRETSMLWPKPQKIKSGTDMVTVCSYNFIDWQINTNADFMLLVIARYNSILDFLRSDSRICTVEIIIKDNNETLGLDTDESYTLHVDYTYARITSQTVYGALHAIETFTQLQDDNHCIVGVPIEIDDWPDFKWRGLLVDTSRHFITFPILKRIVDALSYAKMNVFHWHIIDAQSFPLEIKNYPLLHIDGSYDYPTAVYYQYQITEFIEYARYRGVRVVIEIDSPGHVRSWGKGYPSIVSRCPSIDSDIIDFSPLNPTNRLTYNILGAVVEETADLLQDSYIHLGGDEVRAACYKSIPEVKSWYTQQNFTQWNDIQVHLMTHGMKKAREKNKKIVIWEDMFSYLKNIDRENIVIHMWLRTELIPVVVNKKVPMIMSAPWYLDRQTPGKPRARFHDSWIDFYSYNLDKITKDKSILLGGEACAWSEHMDDANIETRIWPRTAAVAERLWTNGELEATDNTKKRLSEFSCLLRRRGIPSGPIQFPSYCKILT